MLKKRMKKRMMNKKKKRTSLYSQTYRLDELTYMHSRLMRVHDEEYYKVEDDFFDKQYQAAKLELQNQEKEEYEEILEDTQEVEMISDSENVASEVGNNNVVSTLAQKASSTNNSERKNVRMQELENIILMRGTFCIINGMLCAWDEECYTPLNLRTFTNRVRLLLTKEEEDKLSRFNVFKDTYEFMSANEVLKGKFSREATELSKTMIAFKNGIYIGRDGRFIKTSAMYPILFNVDAHYLGEGDIDTPVMDSIINYASGNNREVLKLFYQSIGYIFSQGIEAKKFFVFATAPDSGKSIIGNFLGKVLKDNNVANISLNDLGARFSLGNIGELALNINMDLPASEIDKKSVQAIKLLTGDPRIQCEEKYVQAKPVIHHCKFLFASNHPIKLKAQDEAFYKRMIVIPFLKSVNEKNKDYDLESKLWDERDAILTKAANAYGELCANNFVFQRCQIAEDMVSSWQGKDKNILLYRFWGDRCSFSEEAKERFIPTDKVFKIYQAYCESYGETIPDSELRNFSREFTQTFNLQKGKRRVTGYNSSVNGYVGLQIFEDV